jgi:hypothetical protein
VEPYTNGTILTLYTTGKASRINRPKPKIRNPAEAGEEFMVLIGHEPPELDPSD